MMSSKDYFISIMNSKMQKNFPSKCYCFEITMQRPIYYKALRFYISSCCKFKHYFYPEYIIIKENGCKCNIDLFLFAATQVSITLSTIHAATQCNIPAVMSDDVGVQCEFMPAIKKTWLFDMEDDSRQQTPKKCRVVPDKGWKQNNESETDSQSEAESMTEQSDEGHVPAWDENKYIVFETCLMQLFAVCHFCLAPCIKVTKSLTGSMVTIRAMCLEGHERVWLSQPAHSQMPWGNFLIASACLYSGSHPSKVLLFLRHLKVPCISERLYNTIQRVYLIPAVLSTWATKQKELFQSLADKTLTIGGDARMDSPGHCAKYGSYSLMDLGCNKILDVQTIQVMKTFSKFV